MHQLARIEFTAKQSRGENNNKKLTAEFVVPRSIPTTFSARTSTLLRGIFEEELFNLVFNARV
jgi:hypothetical protein